ncbi:MAG: hypothetical protein M0P71_07480 [Melioribacteraceae bacterium]|nr:hypothetical protein [Melioribacteraceae bacterium]MDD3982805.1 hypothetical protein [Candidatus Omnitrophota bacterium]
MITSREDQIEVYILFLINFLNKYFPGKVSKETIKNNSLIKVKSIKNIIDLQIGIGFIESDFDKEDETYYYKLSPLGFTYLNLKKTSTSNNGSTTFP